jgi:serine/threonine-protein kinase
VTSETGKRLAEFFDRAASSPPESRAAIIAEAEREDPALAKDLVSLLDAHNSSDDYFDKLSRDVIAPALTAIGLDETDADNTLLSRLQEAVGAAYTIERELGRGGMSRVFVANEVRLRRKVVIKVLPPDMSQIVSVERFQREIQLSARLHNPHIVPVLASDAGNGLIYYVMPFVEGETLRARIARDGPLTLNDARSIWCDLLDALSFAHEHKVVHRDVKPENILLSGRNALIADFGIARALEAAADDTNVTATGVTLGTPAYMAPEQASGEAAADHRIDIYAAGLVMYEMLEGHTPFPGRNTRETVLAHLTQQPPPISRQDIPAGLAELVLRCLAKNPEERPQNADVILREIESGPVVKTQRSSRNRNVAAIAAAAATIVLLLGAYVVRRGSAKAEQQVIPTSTSADPRPSLVVLPLVNRSADTADAGLADGMTEELIGTLSKNSSVRIIASTSAFALKGTQQSVRQIADSLHVSNILEGSLQKIGPRLRMQVRLVDAADGSTRWSQVYDRRMTDLFAVEEEISRTVASELDVQLKSRGGVIPRARRYTPNVVAYEWYVRGMDVSLMRSSSGNFQSINYFTRAIAADPKFAAAYAGLVRPYLQLGNAAGPKGRQWVALAEKAAMKAIALDDSLAEGQAALGWTRLVANDFRASESAFKKAVALNPSAPRVHEGLARLYMMTDRPSEQLAEAREGVEADPFSHSAIRELALALNMNGRCDEALEIIKPLKSLTPPAGVAGILAGQCYESKQMWTQAIAEYEWAMRTGSVVASGPAFLGHALARAGRTDEARRILSELLAGEKNSHGAFGIGVLYAGLRDYDNAFAWLNKAADEHSIIAYIEEPMFADLHADPRYAEVRKRMQTQKR